MREKTITREMPAQSRAWVWESVNPVRSSNPFLATMLRIGNMRKVGVHMHMQNEYMLPAWNVRKRAGSIHSWIDAEMNPPMARE